MFGKRFAATKSLILSVLLHTFVGVVLVFSFESILKQPTSSQKQTVNIVEATSIDKAKVELELKRLKERDDASKKEEVARQKRLEKLKQQQAKEQERLQQLKTVKAQEKQKHEAEKERLKKLEQERLVLETKRKQEEEKKKLAEEENKRLVTEKKKREEEYKRLQEKRQEQEEEYKRLEAERKHQEEELRKLQEKKEKQEAALKQKEIELQKREEAARKAAEERERKQQERQQKIEAEAKAKREELDNNIIREYTFLIREAIENKFNRAGLPEDLSCVIQIKMLEGGVIAEAAISKSSGNSLFDRRAETAVRAAAPLPIPPEPRLFEKMRNIRLTFKP